MSELFFDYECVSMGDTNSHLGKKALEFYLFQEYEESGSMCAQIYIPKEIQKNFYLAKVFYIKNGVRPPELNELNKKSMKPEIWYCRDKDSQNAPQEGRFISEDNSIFIKGTKNELSGCGIIGFIDEDNINAELKAENCFKFVINFSKKELIYYSILEKKNKINIKVIYPLIRNDIELNVIQKRGAKPIIIEDKSEKNKVYNTKNDELITIKLNADGQIENYFENSYSVSDSELYDYRLCFANEKDNTHYLLVDESEFTFEDKKDRLIEEKIKNKVHISKPRCPYCGDEINVKAISRLSKKKTLIIGCDGEIISRHTEDKDLKNKLTIVCSKDLVALSRNGNTSYIQENQLILPQNFLDRPNMNVIVAGFPKSGKTIYLASLFNMKNRGSTRGTISYPFILDEIVKVFDKSGNKTNVDEIKYLSIDNNYRISRRVEEDRNDDFAGTDIKTRYEISVGGKIESQTAKTSAGLLSWHPIGYKMGDLGCIYFYDIPGEMYTKDNNEKVRALDMTDCIIAVIDGSPENNNPISDLLSTLEHIPELSSSNMTEEDIRNIPIAIIFTKHDLKLAEYLKYNMEDSFCFDDNCHVVREDILSLLPENGKYEGSELERHIDMSSYELEHYLKARDTDGVFRKIKTKYQNIKFFTCSALGSDARLSDANSLTKKEVLYRPRRLRVELPIIWLMYKKGLIKG